jgi:hypothetical protein
MPNRAHMASSTFTEHLNEVEESTARFATTPPPSTRSRGYPQEQKNYYSSSPLLGWSTWAMCLKVPSCHSKRSRHCLSFAHDESRRLFRGWFWWWVSRRAPVVHGWILSPFNLQRENKKKLLSSEQQVSTASLTYEAVSVLWWLESIFVFSTFVLHIFSLQS